MSHIPTSLDIKTDLRRSIMSSFSKNGFKDVNAEAFLKKAEDNLNKINLDKSVYLQVIGILKKAKDTSKFISERREDMLTASLLI